MCLDCAPCIGHAPMIYYHILGIYCYYSCCTDSHRHIPVWRRDVCPWPLYRIPNLHADRWQQSAVDHAGSSTYRQTCSGLPATCNKWTVQGSCKQLLRAACMGHTPPCKPRRPPPPHSHAPPQMKSTRSDHDLIGVSPNTTALLWRKQQLAATTTTLLIVTICLMCCSLPTTRYTAKCFQGSTRAQARAGPSRRRTVHRNICNSACCHYSKPINSGGGRPRPTIVLTMDFAQSERDLSPTGMMSSQGISTDFLERPDLNQHCGLNVIMIIIIMPFIKRNINRPTFLCALHLTDKS